MIQTISEEERLQTLALNVVSREFEVSSYDLNIRNYTNILASLPSGEWPEQILPYKGIDIGSVPHEHVEMFATYSFRDRLDYLLRTEVNERTKSYMLYQAMYNQLPTDQIQTLLDWAYNTIKNPPAPPPV